MLIWFLYQLKTYFSKRCAETGVDAVLIADVPVLAAEEFTQAAKKHGIQSVFICPPNADQATIERIARLTEGYTYLVSRAGVTSAENQAHAKNLDNLIESLKRSNSARFCKALELLNLNKSKKH
ncbi:tryptophan synthase subunit alpha [Actinobacillus pleuropneumoniae]|nr:tryptophan synthase subunit alpha [Actinobacillus pleuropneumoniae]